MNIGVLGLQGDFREHLAMLARLGVQSRDVRLPEDLAGLVGLVIPGGESTTLRKLLRFSGLDEAIVARARQGMGVYGTCAGMILLAKRILNDAETAPLGLIDIAVSRNAYGRQIDSFEADVNLNGIGGRYHAVFIRAPQIVEYAKGVEVLGQHDGVAVLARQNNVLVGSFHPELSDDPRIHQYFAEQVCAKASPLPA